VKLREASGGRRLWDVAVWFDGEGHMYLERGWEQFARDHDLGLGNFLVFSYDGDAVLTVKVFEGRMCRRHYKHDDDARTTMQVPRSSHRVTIKEEDGCDSAVGESSIDTGRKNSTDSGSKKSTASTRDSSLSLSHADWLCNSKIKKHDFLHLTRHGQWERQRQWHQQQHLQCQRQHQRQWQNQQHPGGDGDRRRADVAVHGHAEEEPLGREAGAVPGEMHAD
jgi:hypothetical protein